jgi:hypothetical protein
MQRKRLGPDHPSVAWVLANLAGLRAGLGDPGAAETMYCESLSIYRASLGAEHEAARSIEQALLQLYAAGDSTGAPSPHGEGLCAAVEASAPR